MWSKPWSYKEGLVIGAGLLVIGLLLQMTVGAIHWDLFACPVNVIVLVVYIIALVAMHLLRKRVYLFGWLSHYSAAVSSLLWVVGMTVVMGLIRQAPSGHAPADLLGFSQMISSWPFVLLYFWMVTALGLTILRASFPFRIGRLSFLLNHVGLFVALITATLGNADMQRLKMTTRMGNAEWRATDDKGKLIELPLAIELKDFTIDEYPPKLMLIDNTTGKALPEKQPENILVEEIPLAGNLQGWKVEVTRSLPMAACVMGQDTINFVEFHSEGATTALYVKARNELTGRQKEGWVSCGSYIFPYISLQLDDAVSMVMPEREPRRFASDVMVYTKNKQTKEACIEVNKPLSIAGWKIYQLSYDETKGKWSRMSVFELVRDPWLPIVYTGILMMIAGAIGLFLSAPVKKE